jgi:prepilin-type N-terminal cleavage/methylation domain-containing protein
MTRRGFTLLEVMIAIVLTSIVALMAFASARVSADSYAVITRRLADVRGERAARQTLLDLLHNVRPPRVRSDTAFALSGDTLRFIAAGAPPLDPDYDWLVAIEPGDSGLSLVGRSMGRGPAASLRLRLPHVTRWQVRVLPPRGNEWKDVWSPAPVMPEAVAMTLWIGDEPAGPPFTVRLSEASSAPAEAEFIMD